MPAVPAHAGKATSTVVAVLQQCLPEKPCRVTSRENPYAGPPPRRRFTLQPATWQRSTWRVRISPYNPVLGTGIGEGLIFYNVLLLLLFWTKKTPSHDSGGDDYNDDYDGGGFAAYRTRSPPARSQRVKHILYPIAVQWIIYDAIVVATNTSTGRLFGDLNPLSEVYIKCVVNRRR